MNNNKIITKLPLHDFGANKGKVDWNKIINIKLEVLYNNKVYNDIEVIEIKNRYLTVKYRDNISKISINNFSTGSFGSILGIKTSKYFYSIGDIIKNKNSEIEILKYIRIKRKNNNTQKGYLVKCLNCKYDDGRFYEFEILESDLKKGIGCACCGKNKVVYGINDIYTQKPDILKLFVKQEEAKTVSYGSTKKVEIKCPLCGNIKKISPNTLAQKGLGCICGDGKSYPEKFLYNILKQLKINFENEKSFEWCKKVNHKNNKLCGSKRYDFYFELNGKKIICETHGLQHYDVGFKIKQSNTKNLQEEQENDRIKKQLAKENGIEYYIIIDCRKSELEWIKNSIINSDLNRILDLSKIDWIEANKFAQYSNIKKEVCNYRNNNPKATTGKIGEMFNLNKNTIARYLKFGNLNHWCEYDSKKEAKAIQSKPVQCLETGKIFSSIKECCEQMSKMFYIKFIQQEVSKVCKGRRESYKGYKFKYVKLIYN